MIGTAADALHAARKVAELRPDLVIMDSRLARLSGVEAGRRAKPGPKGPAVIIVSAPANRRTRPTFEAVNGNGFVDTRQLGRELSAARRELALSGTNELEQ